MRITLKTLRAEHPRQEVVLGLFVASFLYGAATPTRVSTRCKPVENGEIEFTTELVFDESGLDLGEVESEVDELKLQFVRRGFPLEVHVEPKVYGFTGELR